MDKQLYPIHESVRDRIHPEYKEYYNTHLIDKPPTHLVPIEKSRASGNFIPGSGPLVPVGRTEEHCVKRVASSGRDVLVRCFIPEGVKPADGWPVLIYFHGGGWVLGNLDTENSIITNICARAEAVVISVDYR
jgi:triacylglycerol lipase